MAQKNKPLSYHERLVAAYRAELHDEQLTLAYQELHERKRKAHPDDIGRWERYCHELAQGIITIDEAKELAQHP